MNRQTVVESRCIAVADTLVPNYRHGSRAYSCGGHVAKMWQAAYDGAAAVLADPIPADVRRLVIAAREVTDRGQHDDETRELLDAVEAFSSRVPYEDQPDDMAGADELQRLRQEVAYLAGVPAGTGVSDYRAPEVDAAILRCREHGDDATAEVIGRMRLAYAALSAAPPVEGLTSEEGAFPVHIGRLHLGERRSDGERLCSHSHAVPAGHPLYWPQQLSQYDDSDLLCLQHAIEQAVDDNGYCENCTADEFAPKATATASVLDTELQALKTLVAKCAAPNGWDWMFPLRVVPVDGKPTIKSHKGGNLFRGYIGTWDEADLLVALANAAPRILASLTDSGTAATIGGER